MCNTIKFLKVFKILASIIYAFCIIEIIATIVLAIITGIMIHPLYFLILLAFPVPLVFAVLLYKLISFIDDSIIEHYDLAKKVKQLEQTGAK